MFAGVGRAAVIPLGMCEGSSVWGWGLAQGLRLCGWHADRGCAPLADRSTPTLPKGWSCISAPRTPTATPCVPTASPPPPCCSGSGGGPGRSSSWTPRNKSSQKSSLRWRFLGLSPLFTNFKVTLGTMCTWLRGECLMGKGSVSP